MKHALLFALIAFLVSPVFAQHHMSNSERKSPHDTLRTADITVTYGRPYKKGRDIFGKLEPYGKVWRTGADEATEITFKKNRTFGGKAVKAGTYTLFTIPGKTEWTVILNRKLGQWGAFDYDKVKNENALEVTVPVHTLTTPVEQLTISRPASGLQIQWDYSSIVVPIK